MSRCSALICLDCLVSFGEAGFYAIKIFVYNSERCHLEEKKRIRSDQILSAAMDSEWNAQRKERTDFTESALYFRALTTEWIADLLREIPLNNQRMANPRSMRSGKTKAEKLREKAM